MIRPINSKRNREEKLLSQCLVINLFEYKGRIYEADAKKAVSKYLENHTSILEFENWVQENYKEVQTEK